MARLRKAFFARILDATNLLSFIGFSCAKHPARHPLGFAGWGVTAPRYSVIWNSSRFRLLRFAPLRVASHPLPPPPRCVAYIRTNEKQSQPYTKLRGVTLFSYCAVYQLRRKKDRCIIRSVSVSLFGVCSAPRCENASITLSNFRKLLRATHPEKAHRDTLQKSVKVLNSSKKRKKPRKIAIFLLQTIYCGSIF